MKEPGRAVSLVSCAEVMLDRPKARDATLHHYLRVFVGDSDSRMMWLD